MTLTRRNMLAAAGLAFGFSLLPPPANAQDTVELRFADSFPVQHFLSREGMVYFMNRATELSGGKIKWTHFPAEQIAKADGILQAIRTNRVDAGYIGPGYVSDRMPLANVAQLPGLASSATQASKAFYKVVMEGSIREEYKANGLVPLLAVVLPPYQLVLKNGPARNLEEIKGLRLRSAGGSMNLTATAIGATYVAMPAPEMYLAMERGVIDGTFLAFNSVKPYNVHEIAKAISTNGSFGSFAISAAINERTFNKLDPELQKVLLQAGQEASKHLIEYMEAEVEGLLKEFKEKGIELYAFEEADLKAINERLSTVADEWVARMEERKLDGRKVLEEYKAALAAN
jgi:TRAP-type C4-dicarboxylate transport system substrate-binding protein|nr:MAG: hypothetical protein DIU57_11515 [Pseudomonadota bacterium]